MQEDIKDVQTPESVEVTTEEPAGETPKVDQPLTEEKPLSRAEIQELVAEQARKFQSISDRDIRAAQKGERRATRRAQTAESQVASFNQAAATNPQLAAQMKVATQAAQSRAFQERENSDLAEQAKQDFFDRMATQPEKFGIDPNDKRLDYARDADDSIVATDRLMASIATILETDKGVWEKKMEQKMKDQFAQMRKDEGLDSVDNTASSGAGTSSDADFIDKYGKGDLPFTQENLDRADKIIYKEK